MKRPIIRLIVKIGIGCLLLLIGVIVVCDVLVVRNASGRTFDNIETVPHNKLGVLLATSPVTIDGAHNYSFDNRIKAADELFRSGKIEYIIASGGDYTRDQKYGCDEPAAIRDSLIAHGIPADRIILDYEGTRTIKSIANAQNIYHLDSVTFISQKYHNERALYLADKYGLHAIGYNAAPSPIRLRRFKSTIREYLARPKMFLDLLTNKVQ